MAHEIQKNNVSCAIYETRRHHTISLKKKAVDLLDQTFNFRFNIFVSSDQARIFCFKILDLLFQIVNDRDERFDFFFQFN
jgi:hypothetical protein